MVSAIIISQNTHSVNEANLRRIVEALHSARVLDVVVVGSSFPSELATVLNSMAVKYEYSHSDDECSMIAAGIASLMQDELHGVLIFSVHQLRISQAILVDLLHQFWISHKQIVVCSINGKREFTIVADALFNEVQQTSANNSLESFIALHADELLEVSFDENGNRILHQPIVNIQPLTDE